MGSPEDVGLQLSQCALSAGLDNKTQIHGVGDGALWTPIKWNLALALMRLTASISIICVTTCLRRVKVARLTPGHGWSNRKHG